MMRQSPVFQNSSSSSELTRSLLEDEQKNSTASNIYHRYKERHPEKKSHWVWQWTSCALKCISPVRLGFMITLGFVIHGLLDWHKRSVELNDYYGSTGDIGHESMIALNTIGIVAQDLTPWLAGLGVSLVYNLIHPTFMRKHHVASEAEKIEAILAGVKEMLAENRGISSDSPSVIRRSLSISKNKGEYRTLIRLMKQQLQEEKIPETTVTKIINNLLVLASCDENLSVNDLSASDVGTTRSTKRTDREISQNREESKSIRGVMELLKNPDLQNDIQQLTHLELQHVDLMVTYFLAIFKEPLSPTIDHIRCAIHFIQEAKKINPDLTHDKIIRFFASQKKQQENPDDLNTLSEEIKNYRPVSLADEHDDLSEEKKQRRSP